MTSTARMVANHLDEDIVLREALARDVVNFRALARWLARTYGWSAPEETLVTAIRRHLNRENRSLFASAHKILQHAHVNVRAGMCSIGPPNLPEIYERLSDMVRIPNYARGEKLHVITSDRGLKIIFDETNLAKVAKLVGEKVASEARRGLTEVSVFLPIEGRTTPGVLALLCNSLTLHGINIEESADGVSQFMFFVKSKDGVAAHQALMSLTASVQT